MNPLRNYLKVGWVVLTEVPGWPDAPLRARIARALPIVFPVVGIIGVLVWQFGVYDPGVRDQRARMQPLVELDRDVSTLRVTSSDRQLAEISVKAESASHLLLDTPKDLPGVLRELKKDAKERGWDASFQASDTSDEPAADEAQITFLPVRGKLKPDPSNADPFASFLAVLEHLSATNKRIELTRVAIRADESRWQAVEIALRLACPATHEKTP